MLTWKPLQDILRAESSRVKDAAECISTYVKHRGRSWKGAYKRAYAPTRIYLVGTGATEKGTKEHGLEW